MFLSFLLCPSTSDVCLVTRTQTQRGLGPTWRTGRDPGLRLERRAEIWGGAQAASWACLGARTSGHLGVKGGPPFPAGMKSWA